MTPESALDALVASFRSRSPIRIWSLIVTVFGVVALPKSRALRLAELQEWLTGAGIEAGLARTALSRLVAAGTLLRERDGKTALYRLSQTAEAEFRQAATLIYGPGRPEPTGWIELVLIGNGQNRKDVRAELERSSFVSLASGALARPEHQGRSWQGGSGTLLLRAEAGADLMAAAPAVWPLGELADGYRASSHLAEAVLAEAEGMTAHDRLLCRILLTHAFRRVILRDPFLPVGLLPPDWPGTQARALFDRAVAELDHMPYL